MSILADGFVVGGYTVMSLIKEGSYNDTYKVADSNGNVYFMKLYDESRVPAMAKDSEGVIREISMSRALSHSNVVSYVADGKVQVDGSEYPYLVMRYFTGELVAERISRGALYSVEEAVQTYREILAGLDYLHTNGLVHNDITTRNVMFDDDRGLTVAKIIDFGHVSAPITSGPLSTTADLTPAYCAPETFWDTYLPESDIFSATVVLYAMLFGTEPWTATDLPEADDSREYRRAVRDAMKEARNTPLAFPDEPVLPQWLKDVISRGLALDRTQRFATAAEVVRALDLRGATAADEPKNEAATRTQESPKQSDNSFGRQVDESTQVPAGAKVTGAGFSDVAGMDELKAMLQQKVIFLLKKPEIARKYRLTPPNGMLLYGPPGCGKTFFAEKFAEETGFHFHFVKASDLGSTYIHGTQGKIAELFAQAEKNAPAIICFDEFDAMVPNRDGANNQSLAGEVNEFLSQLNNCSQRGVFVIGTTNKPDLIDSAVLRKGRLDLQVYIPEPDETTRKLMFELYLKDRPCKDIDTAELARLTENYVSSDIAYIVNDAAMISAYCDNPITHDTVAGCIRSTRPSLNAKVAAYYREMRKRFEQEGSATSRRYSGFNLSADSAQ